MALDAVPWFIGGGQAVHSADVARLLAYAAFRGRSGIVEPLDMAVTQTPTPSGKVRVHVGACSIESRYTGDQQQCYAVRNPTATDVDVPATGSGEIRYDMLTVRIRDPYPSGSADPVPVDPTVGPYVEFDLITDIEQYIVGGISPDDVESIDQLQFDTPRTAIGLAVIRVPALTATITSSMIRDIRSMIDERSEIVSRTEVGGTQTGGEWDEAGNIQIPDWEHWPQHGYPIRVPPWATYAVVLAIWAMPFFVPKNSVSGTYDARGRKRVQFNDGLGNQLNTPYTVYNVNPVALNNGYRPNLIHSREIAVPAVMRGKTVTARMQVSGEVGLQGRLRADDGSNYFLQVQWLEKPTLPVIPT